MKIYRFFNFRELFRVLGSFSLRKKLVVTFLSILIVVMAVSTVYYINTSTARIKADLQSRLVSNSVAADIMLDSNIKMFDALCTSIANDNSLKMPLQFQIASQIDDYCKVITEKNKNIDLFVLTNASGQVLFSSNDKVSQIISGLVKKGDAFSGLYLIDDIHIISANPVKDNSNVVLGFVVIAHDIEKDKEILTSISSKINTYALLYKGNQLAFMADANKKLYNPKDQKYGAIAADKIYKSKGGSYIANATRNLFNYDLFVSYNTLKNLDANPIGILAVGESDSILKSSISKIILNMSGISLVSIIIAFILIYLFAFRITGPINELVKLMKRVESGDLTVKSDINRKDEIGLLTGSFNVMVEELNRMVKTIVVKSEDIAESSKVLSGVYNDITVRVNNITNSIKEVAEGSETNSAAIEEVSAGLQEVTSEASSIANECSTSIEISCETVNKASNGLKFITNVKNSVNTVAEKSHYTLGKILELEEYSKKIETIVKAIVQVADSINLLGLNAAIEAARAGSFGAGFSVVAEEINKLAAQTKIKVQDVTNLNKEIMNRVKDSVEGIKVSTSDVETSVRLFKELEGTIANITESIGNVDSNMRKITDAVVVQASTSEEIASTMDSISSVTVQTAGASANIYDASCQVSTNIESTRDQIRLLEETSYQLKELTSRFKICEEAADDKMEEIN